MDLINKLQTSKKRLAPNANNKLDELLNLSK